ncbi:MAG: hypothetical protein J0H57_06245, partial [Rhodospirillales bacterium]|nr:hypothetical protein [Rhodospirillales bacterium]
WGSFAQAFMALYAVGVMLWLMDRNNDYSIETYLDYATPKFAFMIWSMLHTNVPLLAHFTRYFSDEDRRTRLFEGGHFYLADQRRAVAAALAEDVLAPAPALG